MGTLDPDRIDRGQWLVMRMSAELEPRRARASFWVWEGRNLSPDDLQVVTAALSRVPARFTTLIPSDVLVVQHLSRK